MSAWIVSKEHIDLLVTAGLDLRHSNDPMRWSRTAPPNEWDRTGELTTRTASEVGMMLWAECLASVAARYPADRSGDRPGPVGFRDSHVPAYKFESIPGRIDPVTVLKQIACYTYQSCEHAGWNTSEAKRFCEALTWTCIEALPGYKAASWGFDDRRHFLTNAPGAVREERGNP